MRSRPESDAAQLGNACAIVDLRAVSGRSCRQSWRSDEILWQSPVEGAQERDDLIDLGIFERDAQLNAAHHLHGFAQRRDGAIGPGDSTRC